MADLAPDDTVELAILERFTAQHAEAARQDPSSSNKCPRELDMRSVVAGITGETGDDLIYLARRWLNRLAPEGSAGANGLLRRCSDSTKNRGEHLFHSRAYSSGDKSMPEPAWDRVREIKRTAGPRAPGAQPAKDGSVSEPVRIFICHSAEDTELAERLVDLLEAALPLRPHHIRCTSVAGRGLPAGANIDERLRIEVRESDSFIGIVSHASIGSIYVLFELGARWGAGRPFIPLMAYDTPTSVLSGPLRGINALRADDESHLYQLVGDLASILRLQAERPDTYARKVRAVIEAQRVTTRPTPPAAARPTGRPTAQARLPVNPDGVHAGGSSDVTPPTLVSFEIGAPTPVPNSFVVDLRARLRDDLSGIGSTTQVRFRSVSRNQHATAVFSGGHLVDGDLLDGVFITPLKLPPYPETGRWSVESFFLIDESGNSLRLKTADLERMNMPIFFEIGSSSDR